MAADHAEERLLHHLHDESPDIFGCPAPDGRRGWRLTLGHLYAAAPIASRTDSAGRPHAYTRPALMYADGHHAYAWHGHCTFHQPPLAPVDRSLSQQVAFFRLDRDAFLLDHGHDDAGLALGGQLVHSDEDMRLFSLTYQSHPVGLLVVRCPSTGTHHALFVPPSIPTCEEARRFTFGDESLIILRET